MGRNVATGFSSLKVIGSLDKAVLWVGRDGY